MKCITCAANIPPEWINALQKNECPNCGDKIMDEASQMLLAELTEVLPKMATNPVGLSGWLLSNYSLKKIGTGEPTQFHEKLVQKTAATPKQKLKIAKNSVQSFLHNKDPQLAASIGGKKDFASIVKQINNGNVDEELYGNGVDLENELMIEENDDEQEIIEDTEDNDPYEEAQANRQQFKSKAKALAKNTLTVPSGNHKPLNPSELAAMMQSTAGGTKSEFDDDMPAAIQNARIDRLRKAREVAEGGTSDYGSKMGTFRRSS